VQNDEILRHTAVNRAAWEAWGAVRGGALRSAESFARGEGNFDPASLPIADWNGLEVLHLQCASGEDTLTLALAGASVTGVDISASNIAHATSKAAAAGIPARFLVADVYELPDDLTAGSFDVVFSGGGALVWLPDIRRWAGIVASCLRVGGRLLLWEGHPIVNCLDVSDDRIVVNDEDYFDRGPMHCPGGPPTPGANVLSALSGVGDMDSPDTVQFAWPLGDVVTAVAESVMRIERLEEGWDAGRERRLPPEVVARMRRLPTQYRLLARRE
jgi:SAM-dependent methyltransferase